MFEVVFKLKLFWDVYLLLVNLSKNSRPFCSSIGSFFFITAPFLTSKETEKNIGYSCFDQKF